MIAHVHTNASDGLLSVDEVMDLGDGPVLILDHLTPLSAIRAHLRDFRKAPLVGSELYVRADGKNEHLTVLAYSPRGFARLCELISACPLPSDWSWADRLDGLMITTSCMASRMYHAARQGEDALLSEAARRIEAAGGVFAVEVFPWDLEDQRVLRALQRAAKRHAGGRMLVSSDYHVPPDPSFWRAYQLGLTARPDRRDTLIHPTKGGEGFFKKMREAFRYVTVLHDGPIPDWLEPLLPTSSILDLCVPRPPDGEIAAFREWLESELEGFDAEHRAAIRAELEAIGRDKETLAYVVLVWRVVMALERRGILPFPRGSAAGSALCWAILGARSPSPLMNWCMFERFYNPARADLPDIDLDVPDQSAAVRALREEGFRVERLCVLRTIPDPEEALRAAATALFGEARRKEQTEKNAEDIALRFGCGKSEILSAAERLARSGFVVSIAPHPSGFVVVPPGWSFPPLPVAPAGVMEAAFVTGDEVRWKVDLLQSDALRAVSVRLDALTIAASARPGDRVRNPFRVGSAGLFQIGPAAAAETMAMRGRDELAFEDLVRLVAGFRPGSSGFLFQEDAMRAAAEAARRRGLDPLRLMDAARRWTAKGDEKALRELEEALEGEEALERLRRSGGYSFCRAHAVAYAARLLAQILVLDECPEILIEAARRERDPAWRAAIVMHLLARLFAAREAGLALIADRGKTKVADGVLVLGEDLFGSLLGFLRQRGAIRRADLADEALSQVVAQMAGFDVGVVVAAAAVIARPKVPNPPPAGACLWTLVRGGLRMALVTPYGAFASRSVGRGMVFYDAAEGRWKRLPLEALARDQRVPDPVLCLEG